MCTIEILRTLLNDCKLYDILSIISDPGMIILVMIYYLISYKFSIFEILMLIEPLSIVVHPTEEFHTDILKVPFGRHLHLCCKAVGIPPPNYIWYHNSNQLQHCISDELDFIITRYTF